MLRNRRVGILAAGVGTRLQPLTNDLPKALLPLGSETLLQYQVRTLRRAGVSLSEIVVITGHLQNRMNEAAGKLHIQTLFNPLYLESNNIVSLSVFARSIMSDRTRQVVIVNCDVLAHRDIFKALLLSPSENAAVVDFSGKADGEAMKVAIENGLIKRFDKKLDAASANGEYIGLAKFGGEGLYSLVAALDGLLRQGRSNDWYESAFNEIAKVIPVRAVSTAGLPWVEIDARDDYSLALALYRRLCP